MTLPDGPETESEEEEDDRIRVADPKQYTQNRRLEQTHNARDRVPQVRRKGYELLHDTSVGFRDSDYRRHVAQAVIDYGVELEPIISRSDSDVLDQELPNTDSTIKDILDTGGQTEDGYISLNQSRWVKRQFDQFMAQVGLGVDLDAGLPEDELKL